MLQSTFNCDFVQCETHLSSVNVSKRHCIPFTLNNNGNDSIFRCISVGSTMEFWARGKKRIAGSRDCLYPRIANGSSVSPYRQWILCILCIADGSCVSPIDPVYRRWILCIADRSCVSPIDPVYRRWILCIANGSSVSSIDLLYPHCTLH